MDMQAKAEIDFGEMQEGAEQASDLLKAMGTPIRLLLLCSLFDKEMSVGELSEKVSAKQSLTSHHLSKLKAAGLVSSRRDEKFVYYSLSNDVAKDVVSTLYNAFCKTD